MYILYINDINAPFVMRSDIITYIGMWYFLYFKSLNVNTQLIYLSDITFLNERPTGLNGHLSTIAHS